jgi:hypothetical protein
MGRQRNQSSGLIFVALGVGLMLTFVFPDKFIIVLLAIALVICGIALCKN